MSWLKNDGHAESHAFFSILHVSSKIFGEELFSCLEPGVSEECFKAFIICISNTSFEGYASEFIT
jgi:RsiW-degrading membrane proteinase PrsW (M82 family)